MPYSSQNGVLQIYVNDPRVKPWTLGFDDWTTRTFKWGTNSGTGVNTVVDTRTQTQVRLSVKCVPAAGDGTKDLGLAATRGYLDTPADWINIEMTGYMSIPKMLSSSGNYKRVSWYGPSGRHPAVDENNPTPDGCTGSCYKGDFRWSDGSVRFNKENYHPLYTHDSYIFPDSTTRTIIKSAYAQSRRVGCKFVNFKYTRPSDGKLVRRIEIWVDIGGAITYTQSPVGRWKLLGIKEDSGNWGQRMTDCKCTSPTQMISWGGPHITYRTDKNQLKLSLATVQEIKPPTTVYSLGQIVTK